jgi:hypothetical protein
MPGDSGNDDAQKQFEKNRKVLLNFLGPGYNFQAASSKETPQVSKVATPTNAGWNEEQIKTSDELTDHKFVPLKRLKRCREEVKSDTSQLRHPSLRVPKLPDPASSTQSFRETDYPGKSGAHRGDLSHFVKPDWYTNAIPIRKPSRMPEKESLDILMDISKTLKIIQKDLLEGHIDRLHELIQKAVFMETNGGLIKAMNMFDKRNGLPSIVANSKLPWYLQADAKSLYFQWFEKCFQYDPIGGHQVLLSKSRKPYLKAIKRPTALTGHKAIKEDKGDENTKEENSLYSQRNFRVFGHNFTDNGQWWPYLSCAHRSGAHGSDIAGISGISDRGATSIVVNMKYHEDEDQGEEIFYTGTESSHPGKPTGNTKLLQESVLCSESGKRNPVRVIRGAIGQKKSIYAPKAGYRYDGLYDVISFTPINMDKQHYLFRLVRCPGQDPIRYQGPERRPNPQELQWWANEQIKRKGAGLTK